MSLKIQSRPIVFLTTSVSVLMGAVFLPATGSQKAKPLTGKQVFAQQCSSCHGAKGQGGPAFPKPLTGTRSPSELAKFISKSMPPGPKKCTPPNAQSVAKFMHDEFYSPIAQERNRPARISLQRLTVKQFRNAVTDLFLDWNNAVPPTGSGGLKAEYFKGSRFDGNSIVRKGVDPSVDFKFGKDGPEAGKYDPHKYSIVWDGSVLAPDTGEYDFIVQSDQAVRLFVNDEKKALVDAWVKSGTESEFHGMAYLMGGRAYKIRLEFSKSTQGVDDSDKTKGKPAPPAFVSLQWKRPKRTQEVISPNFLFKDWSPKLFLASNPFPPDDRSTGYERGLSISKAWDEAVTATALSAARYVATETQTATGIGDGDPTRTEKLKTWAANFAQKAFRRKLTPAELERAVTKHFTSTTSVEDALKRIVILTLKSPQFLYREITPSSTDPYTVASQLSFGLWDTIPDNELRQAAESGSITKPDVFQYHADRMVKNPRSWSKLRDFVLSWLKLDENPDLVKSKKKFPDFDDHVAADLRTSFEMTIEDAIWNDKSDFRTLMTTQKVYLNGRLAKVYGVKMPEDSPFTAQVIDPDKRAGIITHPYLLARLGYLETSSPIHRGVLLARSFMGRVLQPPPAAFAPISATLHPNLTTRERVDLQTKPPACIGCHSMINPLGFTLEAFDAVGRVRTKENGKPIDPTGSYQARSGDLVKLSGPIALSKFLASSDETQMAFVEKLFQHLTKQPVLAYSPRMLPKLHTQFKKTDFNIRLLMTEIMNATIFVAENQNPAKGGQTK